MRMKKIFFVMFLCTLLVDATMYIHATRGRKKRRERNAQITNPYQEVPVVYPTVPEDIYYDNEEPSAPSLEETVPDQNPVFYPQPPRYPGTTPSMNPDYVPPVAEQIKNDERYARRLAREEKKRARVRRGFRPQNKPGQKVPIKPTPIVYRSNKKYDPNKQQGSRIVEPPVIVNVHVGAKQPEQLEAPVYYIGSEEIKQPQAPIFLKDILRKKDVEGIEFNVYSNKTIHPYRTFRKNSKSRLSRMDFPKVRAGTIFCLASLENETKKTISKKISSVNYVEKTKTLIVNGTKKFVKECINKKVDDDDFTFFRLSSFPSVVGENYLKFLRAKEQTISLFELFENENIEEMMFTHSERKKITFAHNYKKNSPSRLAQKDYDKIFERLLNYLQHEGLNEKGISLNFDTRTQTLVVNTTNKRTKDEITQYVVNNRKQSSRNDDAKSGLCIIL